jgi:hypothetical protein
MNSLIISLFSVIFIISGCTNLGKGPSQDIETYSKGEHFESEIRLVGYSVRSDLFKESDILQTFPIPDSAILVDKIHKYATLELEYHTLSDLLPGYLKEIEKRGWSEVEHSGQKWVFEKEGIQVQLSTSDTALTIREITIYSTMPVEKIKKEKAIRIAENILPEEYSDLVLYSSTLEDNVWVLKYREEGTFGLTSCSFKISALNGQVLDKVCAE